MDKVKNDPYFRWPNKISGDVARRNQNLYCSYHRGRGHTTKDCQTLKDCLFQLEMAGYLGEFLVQEESHLQELKGTSTLRTSVPAQGLIGVIHTTSQQTGTPEAPPWILAMGYISNPKLDGLVPKKGH